MQETDNTTALYDVGGAFIIVALLGIPAGSILDYIWNLIVLSITLLILSRNNNGINISKARRLAYCLFITLLGLFIDWAYFELTWDTLFAKSALWSPAMPQALQFAWLLLPVIMISLVNFSLSYSFLKLDKRHSIIVGIAMGVFTAPWLLPTLPYMLGWVQ